LFLFSSVTPQRTAYMKVHPRWQPVLGLAVHVGWGDCWIRTQDCSFTIWCCYQWATSAPYEPPLLPMSYHCSLWAITAPYEPSLLPMSHHYSHFNPLTMTRQCTVTHFHWFLTVLEDSPIGVKFSTTTSPRTLYTVKKKKIKNFQNFFSFESLNRLK
jgi:hypothetical protein